MEKIEILPMSFGREKRNETGKKHCWFLIQWQKFNRSVEQIFLEHYDWRMEYKSKQKKKNRHERREGAGKRTNQKSSGIASVAWMHNAHLYTFLVRELKRTCMKYKLCSYECIDSAVKKKIEYCMYNTVKPL